MEKIFELLPDFYRGATPLEKEFVRLKKTIPFEISPDYLEFMKNFDGGEGTVGEKYLAIWNINDVLKTSQFYKKEDSIFHENYFVFGSNSGIFTYAFNKKNGEIEELDLYEMDYKRTMGTDIESLIIKLMSEPL